MVAFLPFFFPVFSFSEGKWNLGFLSFPPEEHGCSVLFFFPQLSRKISFLQNNCCLFWSLPFFRDEPNPFPSFPPSPLHSPLRAGRTIRPFSSGEERPASFSSFFLFPEVRSPFFSFLDGVGPSPLPFFHIFSVFPVTDWNGASPFFLDGQAPYLHQQHPFSPPPSQKIGEKAARPRAFFFFFLSSSFSPLSPPSLARKLGGKRIPALFPFFFSLPPERDPTFFPPTVVPNCSSPSFSKKERGRSPF